MRNAMKKILAIIALFSACSSPSETPGAFQIGSYKFIEAIPAEAQRLGDPTAGYNALVNNDYISCGLPFSVYENFLAKDVDSKNIIEGRKGLNSGLPYYFTAFMRPNGAKLVSQNCLVCHARRLGDQVVIGLGDNNHDFTQSAKMQVELAGAFASNEPTKSEWRRFLGRVSAVDPYILTQTIGLNPADNLTAALIAHRDRKTLAWSDDALLEPPPKDVLPVDVPPWWRMRKKNAMFYSGMGRGDHARIMMTASILCADSVEEARRIDSYFPDIEAYIKSIKPPAYPFAVNAERLSEGEAVFASRCAVCHGTAAHYPNLIVSLETVGTDPALALGSWTADRFVRWYNQSFFGELARMQPAQGYMAPPLDGIWVTAPYLHNGSVPSLATLLDSSKRPIFWTRNFTSTSLEEFDPQEVGWKYTVLQSATSNADYDTTRVGYGNGGHTFGDVLADGERVALIEYLKTL
jgi:mono/diheme cytochrome c family protein